MNGLELLSAHLVGDFFLQSSYVSQKKHENVLIRAWHVSLYCLPFLAVFLWSKVDLRWLLFVWITHFIIDSRVWAKNSDWPPKPFIVDQTLHIIVLAVIQHFVNRA